MFLPWSENGGGFPKQNWGLEKIKNGKTVS